MDNSWLSETKKQLRAGQLENAYEAALARLAEVRSDGDAWGVMSLVALAGNNPTKSLNLSKKSLDFGSRDMAVLAGRGRALLVTGNQDEARKLVQSIDPKQCTDALEADTIGVILARTGLHEKAVKFFQYATAKQNDQPQLLYNLATSLQFIGKLEEAANSYRALLRLDPDFHRARLALVQLTPQSDDDLRLIETLFDQHSDDPASALQLGHAAAKIFEQRGEYQTSLEWLRKAKALKHRQTHHQREWVENLFAAARNRQPQTGEADLSPDHDPTATQVFIIGMPRSGTTLIERILSSHTMVATAGELPDLALLVKRSNGTPGAHSLSPETIAASYDPAFVGGAYRERTRQLAGGKSHLIDKMPFNFFFAGHILESLPRAKIIMIRRDPRDTVFANYRQLFATDFGYYNYAYDLEDTAHFVSQFGRLANQWKTDFPSDRYCEIAYEDMIGDQESQSRRLIKFLDLDWQDQCLQFHNNDSPVATASSVQVRSPIHSKSVGQWQRYGEAAALVDEALNDFGEA